MTTEEFGFVTSIFSIGGLLGSFFAGRVADHYGRRKTAIAHSAVFVLGLTLTVLSSSYYMILLGRLASGLAAGLALVITPLFISEVLPPSVRGFFGAMNQVLINLGICTVLLTGAITQSQQLWRFPLLGGVAAGLLNLVLLYFACDELPAWLMRQGHDIAAHRALHRLRGGDIAQAAHEARLWNVRNGDPSLAVSTSPSASAIGSGRELALLLQYLLLPEYHNLRTVVTGILVLQQFSGINSIVFYGTSILSDALPGAAAAVNCFLQIVNLAVTFGAASVIDRLGRRPLLKTLTTFLAVGSALVGWGATSNNIDILILGLVVFIIAFALGLGPIPFLLVSEVTQPQAQALAQSWGTTMNWVATFVVGYWFPQVSEKIGGYVYYIFTAFCIATCIFTVKVIPETMGRLTYVQVWGNA